MNTKWTKNFDNAPQVSQANLAQVAHLTARQEHLVATVGKVHQMLGDESVTRETIIEYIESSLADGLRTTVAATTDDADAIEV